MLVPFAIATLLATTQPKKPVNEWAGEAIVRIEAPPKPLQASKFVPLAPVTIPDPEPAYEPPVASYGGTGDANLDYIISMESGGNPYAVNSSSGACGLGQSLPCSKVLNACGSLSNVSCQIEWVRGYCIGAYGSTANAAAFWRANRWY